MQLRSRKNPDMARKIGARIRDMRVAAGLTQEQLAWDCSLDRGYVGHIECGDTIPSVQVLAQLAARLGANVLDVLAVVAGDDHAALLDAVRRRDGDAARTSLRALGVE